MTGKVLVSVQRRMDKRQRIFVDDVVEQIGASELVLFESRRPIIIKVPVEYMVSQYNSARLTLVQMALIILACS